MSEVTWGHAPHVKLPGHNFPTRDTSVCDLCGKPATQFRDLSVVLPDYYGFCEEHAAYADARERAERERQRRLFIDWKAVGPELLKQLTTIRSRGVMANVKTDGTHCGGKHVTKDVWQFPRDMLPEIDAAIARAEGRHD